MHVRTVSGVLESLVSYKCCVSKEKLQMQPSQYLYTCVLIRKELSFPGTGVGGRRGGEGMHTSDI